MADLRERETPEAKVYAYIKDPLFGKNNTQNRKFVQILGFRNVQTTINMSGKGTANISFSNNKSEKIRFVPLNNLATTDPNQGAETTNFDCWFEFMHHLTDGSVAQFTDLWRDVVLSRGDLGLLDYAATLTGSSKFIERSRSRGDVADLTQTVKNVYKYALIYTIPFLNVFDPIFVDYKGQDGRWYAGFTGLITRISENYGRTSDQSISIACSDLSCLLDNVSLVSGWNMLAVAESNSNLRNFVYSSEGNLQAQYASAYANIFQNFEKIEDVILQVIKTAQDMWRFEKDGMGKFTGDVGVRAFKFDVSKAYDYTGISGRRGSIQINNEDMKSMDPQTMFGYTADPDNIAFYMTNPNSRSHITGEKKIFIDPLIRNFDQLFIHKLLNRDFALFKDSLKSADAILNEIAAKMFAYKYFDGNGNLVFELAKPNALPNFIKYGGRSAATVLKHIIASEDPNDPPTKRAGTPNETYVIKKGDTLGRVADENGLQNTELVNMNGGLDVNNKPKNTIIFSTKNEAGVLQFSKSAIGKSIVLSTTDRTAFGGVDSLTALKENTIKPSDTQFIPYTVSDAKTYKLSDDDYALYQKYTTLNFHGMNYILNPDDFVSFTSSFDEAALTTVVATDISYSYIDDPSSETKGASQSFHGVAVADYDYLSKLGVRRYQTQVLYNVFWPDANSASRVLSYQSAAVLERVNSMADSGSFTLLQRPELQLGRTYINPLRMKSYIITGITNSWRPGGPHTTTLSVTYGHPLHKTLEVPWLAIFMEPKKFFAKGINALAATTKADKNGTAVVGNNGADTTYVKATGGTPK
jgi:LysM repeat protein